MEDILEELRLVLETFECNLKLKIMARVAYDGSTYYNMEEKEERDKWEKETKYK